MLHMLSYILLFLLIAGAVFVIIADNGQPSAKLSWLLIIAVVPVFGLVLYILLGINNRHHWIYRNRHARFLRLLQEQMTPAAEALVFGEEDLNGIEERFRPLARLLGHGGRPSAKAGNDFEIITSGQRKFELLTEDIRNARDSIHMEYFRFGRDSGSRAVRDLLMQKAREGVKVRFIDENIVNFSLSSRYLKEMMRAGVDVKKFTDPRKHLVVLATKLNYRNHRKIVVIDGKTGYIGGMNINNNYFLSWRDTHMRLTGKAVASLQHIFLDSWVTAGGSIDKALETFLMPPASTAAEGNAAPFRDKIVQIVPDEPEGAQAVIRMGYEWVLGNAKRYIWMQTPYFVPPEPVLSALKAAAIAGTDVRLMLPRTNDTPFVASAARSFYKECLEAGVRIFERGGNFMHCKTFVCDDYLSSVGSANLDYRSLEINYEVNAYIYDRETALHCKEIFLRDMELCSEVTVETIAGIPAMRRFLWKLAGLFSPLM